jgi:hypothetical protein
LKALIEGAFVMLSDSLFQYLAILTEYEFFLTAVLNLWCRIWLLFILVLNLIPSWGMNLLRGHISYVIFCMPQSYPLWYVYMLMSAILIFLISRDSLCYPTSVFVLLLSFVHSLFCRCFFFIRDPDWICIFQMRSN